MPEYNFYTEVVIPGTKLRLDIFSPALKLVVEVHGQQHYEYNSHFHKTNTHKFAADQRDLDKKEWCENNNFAFAELPFDREQEWPEILKTALLM